MSTYFPPRSFDGCHICGEDTMVPLPGQYGIARTSCGEAGEKGWIVWHSDCFYENPPARWLYSIEE